MLLVNILRRWGCRLLLLGLMGGWPGWGWAQTPADTAAPPLNRQTQTLIDTVLRWQYTPRQTAATRLLQAERRRCQQRGLVREEIYVLNILAFIASQGTDYVRTEQWATEAVRLAKRHHIPDYLSDTYYALGISAHEQQDMRRAAEFFRTAIQYPHHYSKQAQGRHQHSLTMLGSIYLDLKDKAQARPWLKKALAEAYQLGQPIQEFSLLAMWAHGLRELQPDTARVLAQQALTLAQTKLTDDPDQPRALNYAQYVLMQTAQVQQRWPEVVTLGRQVVTGARQTANLRYESEALLAIGQALRQMGQGAAAYDTLARYNVLTDTLNSQAKAEELARTQARLGAVEQEARIRDLEQKRRITALEAAQARARSQGLLTLAGALVLLLLGAGYAYWRLRQSRAALALSEASAKAANETKDRLMSIIGHDLRGPVANFQQALLLVRHYADHPDPDEQRTLADELSERAHRLSGLLDNLLFWGSSQRNEVRNHPEALALGEQFERVAGLYGPMAAAKKIHLRQVLPDPHPTAWADPTLVSTLLRNLVSNAIKFTPHGGEVVLAVAPGPGGQLTITVRDTGVGLTPDQLAHLFDVRANRSTRGTAREQGTGLGLLVCRHFAELLGGELTVQSQPGQGAAFAFTVAAASLS